MILKKALRKIFITTVSVFIVFVFSVFPNRISSNFVPDTEIIYVSNTTNQEIYLLGENQYLVKFQTFLTEEDTTSKVKRILEYLKVNSKEQIPRGLTGIINEKTKILSVEVSDKTVTLDFSKELLEIDKKLEERMIEAIVYSLTSLNEIENVVIKVENNLLTKLPQSEKDLNFPLTREFGINKVYDITNRNGIQKVTIFYLNKISNNNYYVPVTKYVNDSRDKIKIIIDNLASSYIHEENLMSYLRDSVKIDNYEEVDNMFVLNLIDEEFQNNNILESIEYTLKYSIFENYDVDKIKLSINGEMINEYERY